jgi:uncharacterized protein YjhX (UPF0386 family)
MNTYSIPQFVPNEYAQSYIRACLTSVNIDAPDMSKVPVQLSEIVSVLHQINTQDGVEAAKATWQRLIDLHPPMGSIMSSQSRKLHHISKLGELPKTTYLIDQEIPERSLVVMYGQSGAGKSFAALGYAIRIAETQPVIYIGAEGQSGYPVRAEAYVTHHKLNKENLDLYFDFAGINISNPLEVLDFVGLVKPLKPKFIVVDTLARTMEGDENTSRDMNLFIKGCDLMRLELDATVMIVHHTVKKGGSERGSGSLRAAVDVMIGLQNHDGIIEIFCDKSKDAREFDKKYLRLQVVELPNGDSSCVLEPTKATMDVNKTQLTSNQCEILEFLALEVFREAGATSSVIQRATEIVHKTVFSVLSKLKKAGLLKQSKKGDPYFITEQGLQAIGADSTDNS